MINLREQQRTVDKLLEEYTQAKKILCESSRTLYDAFPLIVSETMKTPRGEYDLELCITFAIVLNEPNTTVSLRREEVEVLAKELITWLDSNPKEEVEELGTEEVHNWIEDVKEYERCRPKENENGFCG